MKRQRFYCTVPLLGLLACAPAAHERDRESEAALTAVTTAPGIEWVVDPAQATWVKAENARSRALLAANPLQATIKARAAELVPQNVATQTNFFDLSFAVSKGSILLKGKSGAADRVIVDAALLPTGSAIVDYRLSPDKSMLVYGYAVYGSDWTTWRALALSDLHEVAGPIRMKNAGVDEINWSLDSKGFFYANWLTAPEDEAGARAPQVKYHRIGDAPDTDAVVFEDDEPNHNIKYNAQSIDDTRAVVYRVLSAAEVPLALYLAERDAAGRWSKTPLVVPARSRVFGRYLGKSGSKLFVRESHARGNYAVTSIDLDTWTVTTVVPERRDQVLNQAQQIGDKLVLQYLDATLSSTIEVTDLAGSTQRVLHPHDFGFSDEGAFSLLTGNSQSTESYLTYSTPTLPTETLKLDVATATFSQLPAGPVSFGGAKVKSELTTFTSSDGRAVPIRVYSRTDVATPASFVYLAAYGSIGIPNLPSWNRKFELMLELGGRVAVVAARGGGEFGLRWQKAGQYDKWQTIEDVAYASRFLKATYPEIGQNVVLSGRSYGGMLTMAAYAHAQDDFAVFTPVVGMSDPIAALDERGWVYFDDLGFFRNAQGAVVDSFLHRSYMRTWSPLAGLTSLPTAKPMMAFSAQYDTRVSSSQTVRFVQALQAKFGSGAPVYQIEHENVGHNGRAEIVDEAVFVATQLGLTTFQPIKP